MTVSATSHAGGVTGSANQTLYYLTQQVVCSFDCLPHPDLSLIDELLPGTYLPRIQELIENAGPEISGLHTVGERYEVTFDSLSPIYAQPVLITNRHGKTVLEATGYGSKQILAPPDSEYDGLMTGCSVPGNIA